MRVLMQRVELRFKLIADLDNPAHRLSCNMLYNPYDVKPISCLSRPTHHGGGCGLPSANVLKCISMTRLKSRS